MLVDNTINLSFTENPTPLYSDWTQRNNNLTHIAQSAWTAEYADCISAEG